jgi:hypothetical protein
LQIHLVARYGRSFLHDQTNVTGFMENRA